MPPKIAVIKENKHLTHDVIEMIFETPEEFTFTAGQFVTIKIDDNVPPCFRAYSIASAPGQNSKIFRLCLKIVENGRGTNWLKDLKEGHQINYIGPSGKFVFNNNGKNTLFIATGTGVTPFSSIIEDELKKGNKNKMHLMFGLRNISHIFYQDFFEQLAKQYPNFTYNYTISKPEDESWQGKVGRVSALLEQTNIDPENTQVYICGLKEMINDVVAILKQKGLNDEDIHREDYD